MRLLKYKADRIPIACVLLVFAVDLTVYFLAPYQGAIAWMLLGIFPKSCICSFGHHHQHVPSFRFTILNRLIEIVYAFQTGLTTNVWFLHHVVGHHQNYKDQDADESRWVRDDGSQMGTIEYAATIALTGYPRAYTTGKGFPKHRRVMMMMIGIQLALLTALFVHNWVNALFIFLLPMVISLYITTWHTYYHHAGLHTDSDFDASYNIIHKWYNILTGNLGYHTAHHLQGGLHWSKLPELHEKIEDKISPRLYRRPCIPFSWMGRDAYMPREAEESHGKLAKRVNKNEPAVSTAEPSEAPKA